MLVSVAVAALTLASCRSTLDRPGVGVTFFIALGLAVPFVVVGGLVWLGINAKRDK